MVTLLRTLTRKSLLKYGKYSDYRVGDVLSLGNIRYLRWFYYTFDKINFTDEILDELKITEEWRIEKPGSDPNKNKELNELMNERMGGMQKLKMDSRSKKKFRINGEKKYRKNTSVSKSYLTRKNHGH